MNKYGMYVVKPTLHQFDEVLLLKIKSDVKNKRRYTMRKLIKVALAAVFITGMAGLTGDANASPAPPTLRPYRVVQVESQTNIVFTDAGDLNVGGTVWYGPNWGFQSTFELEVISNRGSTDIYPYGKPHESFTGLLSFAPPGHPWNYPDAGTWPTGVNASFYDYNGAVVNKDPSVHGSDDGNVPWYSFNQRWNIVDAPGTSDAIPAGTLPAGQTAFHLNTDHLTYRRAYCSRDAE